MDDMKLKYAAYRKWHLAVFSRISSEFFLMSIVGWKKKYEILTDEANQHWFQVWV